MRVLHLFKTYHPDTFGGVERTIHSLAKGGLSYGISADVLSLSRDPVTNTQQFDGHMAYKAKLDFQLASTGFSLEAVRLFKELAQKADIVHYHFPWPFMDLLHVLCDPDKPTLVTYHSDIVKQQSLLRLYTPLMHRFLSSVNRIVATSPNYVESSEVLRKYGDKTTIIPIGLDESDYPQAPATFLTHWRSRFSGRFFLFVGVLRYYKGLHTLIEAAKQVNAAIAIVGTGPLERELKAYAAKLRVQNVHFLGSLEDEHKAALLELCTAFVFPSHLRSEAYGLALVEAAMFGKPMITCEIGTGTSYVNKDRESGIVTSPENPDELVQAMNLLLTKPLIAHQYGQGAQARYRNQLRAELMTRSYLQLYQSMTDVNPRT